jgi:CRP-like cAMP-binding protein
VRTAFDVREFLATAGVARSITHYRRGQVIFHQGDEADAVLFLQSGTVKLSVVSDRGKEAVVAVIAAEAFFGEGALTGAPRRLGHATALEPCAVLVIDKEEMTQRLAREPALASRFIAHLLARNVRVEADLVDQLFNSSERRLARALLLLARYGTEHAPHRTLPRVSQELLAEMVGTTRSRVNFFMNKFRRLGFVDYNGDIKVHHSLLNVVLHDDARLPFTEPDARTAAARVAPRSRTSSGPRGRGRGVR